MEDVIGEYLKAQIPSARVVQVKGFRIVAGGYSRETYACDYLVEHDDGRAEAAPIIVRRDPPPLVAILENSRLAEHRLLNRLHQRTRVSVPRSLFVDETGAAFGRPTMLIERAAGKSDLTALFGGADADQLESVATDLCEQLAALHTTPVATLDPDGEYRDPRGAGIDASSWRAYIDSTLAYYRRNYDNIAFDPFPVYYDAYHALQNQLPAPGRLVLCHGDFQTSNFLYKDGKISALIDWENAHIGDPREDLGWLAMMQIMTGIDIMGAVKVDGGFLGHYTKLTGIPVTPEDIRFFQLFAASGVGAPVVAAVKRRFEGRHSELLHVYLLQAVVVAAPVFAAVMGYPPPPADAITASTTQGAG